MAKFIEAFKIADVADGEMKVVKLEGKGVLIARISGKLYATDNSCPHFGGKFSQGKLEGGVVTCPRHGSQFDLTSGNVIRWIKTPVKPGEVGVNPKGSKNLKSYPVRVEADKVLVEI